MNSPPYGAFAAQGVAFVTLVFLIIVATRGVRIPTGWFRYVFFVTLGAIAAFLLSGGSFSYTEEPTLLSEVLSLVLYFMGVTPLILVLEAGITGYLGFKGRWRYVGLALLILGATVTVTGIALSAWVHLKHRN